MSDLSSSSTTRVKFEFPFNPPDIALPLPDESVPILTSPSSDPSSSPHLPHLLKYGVTGIAGLFALGSIITLYRAMNQHNREKPKPSFGESTSPSHSTASASSSASSSSFSATPRRTTGGPISFIDDVKATKGRQSAHHSSNPSEATTSSLSASSSYFVSVNVPNYVPHPPLTLGIITPRSLEKYGKVLKQGFDELLAKNAANMKSKTTPPMLGSVELCVPNVGESIAEFAKRVQQTHKFDVLLLQYHGAEVENPVVFESYHRLDSVQEVVPRILLLHRPIEILERQSLSKDPKHNVKQLLNDVDVVVVLGESPRATILKQFPSPSSANVCVVPHGFVHLDESAANKVRRLTPITVIGAMATWNDMRWVRDLLQLRKVIAEAQSEKRRTSFGNTTHANKSNTTHASNNKNNNTSSHQIVIYGCGNFQTYKHPQTKVLIDEWEILTSEFKEFIVTYTKDEYDSAVQSKQIHDAASMKNWLWGLSQGGKCIVLSKGEWVFNSPLHSDLFDFTPQLFREILTNFTPKYEYSYALHEKPGATINIVFQSPPSHDVEIEGMNLLMVPYNTNNDASSSSKEDADSCPWYPSSQYIPNFLPVVQQIFHYLNNPNHYQAHRQQTFQAAQQMTMRHIAAQYQQIITNLFNQS